jgi:hypothetical protein
MITDGIRPFFLADMRVADALADCPDGDATPDYLMVVWASLAASDADATAADFEVACALYWAATHTHTGQGDPRYALACSLDYRPGACERGPEPGSAAAVAYDGLLALWG